MGGGEASSSPPPRSLVRGLAGVEDSRGGGVLVLQ
jgi:hypothetical protein